MNEYFVIAWITRSLNALFGYRASQCSSCLGYTFTSIGNLLCCIHVLHRYNCYGFTGIGLGGVLVFGYHGVQHKQKVRIQLGQNSVAMYIKDDLKHCEKSDICINVDEKFESQ
jgi:hypothetical protein